MAWERDDSAFMLVAATFRLRLPCSRIYPHKRYKARVQHPCPITYQECRPDVADIDLLQALNVHALLSVLPQRLDGAAHVQEVTCLFVVDLNERALAVELH